MWAVRRKGWEWSNLEASILVHDKKRTLCVVPLLAFCIISGTSLLIFLIFLIFLILSTLLWLEFVRPLQSVPHKAPCTKNAPRAPWRAAGSAKNLLREVIYIKPHPLNFIRSRVFFSVFFQLFICTSSYLTHRVISRSIIYHFPPFRHFRFNSREPDGIHRKAHSPRAILA